MLADAGADALELNVYRVPTDPHLTAGQVEQMDLALVDNVCASVAVPVAVKLSPYYSAMASFAAKVVSAGAAGLVLFNRFYQPDLDLETMDVVPKVELSRAWELRCRCAGSPSCGPSWGRGLSLAATSGVHTGTDVVKALAVGADVAMMTSAILRSAPPCELVESELRSWLAEHDYTSVSELRGSVSQSELGRRQRLRTGQLSQDPALLDDSRLDRHQQKRRHSHRSVRPCKKDAPLSVGFSADAVARSSEG